MEMSKKALLACVRIVAVVVLTVLPMLADAQCAMCRTQVVNNVSHGETSFAAGLNTGIMYLFFTPYLMIGVVVFLWFRYSRVNETKESIVSRLRRQVPKM